MNSLNYDVPLVSTRYARRFVRFIESRGLSMEAMLNGSQIDPGLITNPDAFLSVGQVIKVLEQADVLLQDERAGFEFGQQLDLIAHGLFGYVLLSQDDIGKLVETVVQHLRICLPLIDMEFNLVGGDARIRLIDTWNTGSARKFLSKVYMGSIYTIASQICKNLRFELDFPSELPDTAWKALTHDAHWQFGSTGCQVTLPLIHRHSRDSKSNVAYSLARERCRESELPQKNSGEIAVQVREKVLKQPGKATLERIAQQMDMSTRYLRHHLAMAGTSFREVRSEVRRSYADLYLAETPLSLEDIARKLGFSDQASFTRAYRSWTGKTPGDVRRQAKII